MNFAELVSRSRHCACTSVLITIVATGVGCGAGNSDAVDSDTGAQARSQARPPAAAVVTPLLLDDGSMHPGDPAARPGDAGAWTSSGRYATAAQARVLVDALREDVLEVNVDCCSAQAVDLAVGIAWGMQAARDLPNHTPVLVRGSDLRLAAAAANRLASGGLTHVWLVTMP